MNRTYLAGGWLVLAGCFAYTQVDVGFASDRKEYVEKTVTEDPDPQGKIALIDVDGVISDQPEQSLFSSKDSLVVAIVQKLKKAEEDPKVKGVILRMNTPGGEVTASDILYHEIRAFKDRKKVPVVAAFLEISASGGYYIASACDRIVAHPTTITGSIGVVALHFSLGGLLTKIGVKVDAIKSGEHKDMGSPFRDATDEERKLFQDLIDQMYARFVRVVTDGRRGLLTEDQVRKLADGRVYTADQALKEKLVDRVGYLHEVIEETKTLAGLRSASVVMYTRRPTSAENIYSATAQAPSLGVSELDRVRGILGMHLYYVWEPYLLGR